MLIGKDSGGFIGPKIVFLGMILRILSGRLER